MTQNVWNSDYPVNDGEIIIGQTGGNPQAATITAGNGIEITNAAGAITITSTGQKEAEIVTANTAMVVDTNYITNGTTKLEMTLPAAIAVGSIFRVTDINSGFKMIQGVDQYINFGNRTTTVGASGNVDTLQDNSSLTLICVEENLGFNVLSAVGNFNLDAV